ncbi:MAG TPA: site-2 protease family protein [Thermoplasmata archaeon]|nr:site-2 protease family protein [Thermoplasmata archaeon]
MAAGTGPLPGASPSELERLKALVGQYFPVYETKITANSLILLVHADPATLEPQFDRMRQELWPLFYVPQIRQEGGEYVVEVVRRPPVNPWGPYVNLALLVATVASTVVAGSFLWVAYRGGTGLTGSDFLWGAVFFAAPLLLILGLHELAHYVMARRHHVDASLPYFLPVPPPILIFGTFGAFISLREPFPDKKALLDIGVAGPLVGFVVALPITLLGLHLSLGAPALSPASCGPTFLGFSYGNLLVGTPAIWSLFALFIPGALTNLHPLALAGWVGILVTAFNLLPAGQLDGGHVARALLGKNATYASWIVLGVLVVIGFEFYFGWLIFAIFIFLVGMRHPPPLNDLSPVGWKRVGVGLVGVAILVGGFTLVPLATPNGSFHLQSESSTQIRPLPAGAAMADNLTLSVANQDLVDHAYLMSATIVQVVQTVGGNVTRLNGTALTSFEANSTWIVTPPNGNVSTFAHAPSFSSPRAAYALVGDGATGRFNVVFQNPQQAAVTLDLVVTQLCPVASAGNTNSWQVIVY